jgi:hypothetical protein
MSDVIRDKEACVRQGDMQGTLEGAAEIQTTRMKNTRGRMESKSKPERCKV